MSAMVLWMKNRLQRTSAGTSSAFNFDKTMGRTSQKTSNGFARRAVARGAICALIGLGLLVAGCELTSCGDRPNLEPDDPDKWAVDTELARFVPTSARAVAVARDLETFDAYADFAEHRWSVAELRRVGRLVERLGAGERLDGEAAEKLGLSQRAPVVTFYDRGYWSVALGVDEPQRLEEAVEAAGLEGKTAEFGSFDATYLEPAESSESSAFFAHDGHLALIALPVDASVDAESPRLPSLWLPDSERTRFVETNEHRDLLMRFRDGEFVGVVRPSTWLANVRSEGHAEVLRQQLMSQLGPVGFQLNSPSLDETARLEVAMPGNSRAPEMVPELGGADGELPPMGGLIEPGVLSVARLSVDPEQLYALASSAMPAERRNNLGATLERLDEDLRIDVESDVLENLRGHAMLVAYGLEREAFESDETPWFLELVKLQATREAILMPIRDREPLEQVLDGWTTLSKSKLSRQRAGQTLQYAWLEEGELQWAFILSDKYLIFVDSAAAFEHAVAYEERARPLGEEFEEHGLTRLVDGQHQAGLFVDTATLTDLLAESERTEAVRWLRPFDSMLVTSGLEDDVGIVQVDFRIGSDGGDSDGE